WVVASPVSLLWWIPLTMVPQAWMAPTTFGPDASIGLLPLPSVLAYYAVFFFFGALYWDAQHQTHELGKRWHLSLPFAAFVLFPIGLDITAGSFGWTAGWEGAANRAMLGNLLQAGFAWLMTLGLIGAFRSLLAEENKGLRYLSDASYWLYLAHLPIVILAQWAVRDLSLPAWVKFSGITILCSGVLLMSYQLGVRYTFIGTILNGKRFRPGRGLDADRESIRMAAERTGAAVDDVHSHEAMEPVSR
ncbi:MAG: acyltransferase family protein, partial [Planctomycetota bacterium]